MTMAEVANAIEVHETTVSRAIANKYLKTPHGTPRSSIFSRPDTRKDGGTVSNTSVKEIIGGIIEGEDPEKPLSDRKIVDMLKEKDISSGPSNGCKIPGRAWNTRHQFARGAISGKLFDPSQQDHGQVAPSREPRVSFGGRRLFDKDSSRHSGDGIGFTWKPLNSLPWKAFFQTLRSSWKRPASICAKSTSCFFAKVPAPRLGCALPRPLPSRSCGMAGGNASVFLQRPGPGIPDDRATAPAFASPLSKRLSLRPNSVGKTGAIGIKNLHESKEALSLFPESHHLPDPRSIGESIQATKQSNMTWPAPKD